MPRFECECSIDCYLLEDEIEAENEEQAKNKALKYIETCDVEPECYCVEVTE